MKKMTLLKATLLTATCIGGSALTANAASPNCTQITQNGNRIIISYGSGCNNSSLAEQIQSCLQNILQNCPNNQPENNVPDTDQPEHNVPDTDKPEHNTPDTNKPEHNTPEHTTPGDNVSEDESALSYINQVVSLVNAERTKARLDALTIDSKLQTAAQVRAQEIETSFSHTRPNGTSFATAIKEQNLSYRSAGENIAWGQRSPQEVVTAWMNSPGHRANIMNANFTKIGVGYYQNSRGVNYWSQLFTN